MDSSIIITKKSDYGTILDTMIYNSIMKGNYREITENTLKEILWFQNFVYRNFPYNCYKDLQPDSNPLACHST